MPVTSAASEQSFPASPQRDPCPTKPATSVAPEQSQRDSCPTEPAIPDAPEQSFSASADQSQRDSCPTTPATHALLDLPVLSAQQRETCPSIPAASEESVPDLGGLTSPAVPDESFARSNKFTSPSQQRDPCPSTPAVLEESFSRSERSTSPVQQTFSRPTSPHPPEQQNPEAPESDAQFAHTNVGATSPTESAVEYLQQTAASDRSNLDDDLATRFGPTIICSLCKVEKYSPFTEWLLCPICDSGKFVMCSMCYKKNHWCPSSRQDSHTLKRMNVVMEIDWGSESDEEISPEEELFGFKMEDLRFTYSGSEERFSMAQYRTNNVMPPGSETDQLHSFKAMQNYQRGNEMVKLGADADMGFNLRSTDQPFTWGDIELDKQLSENLRHLGIRAHDDLPIQLMKAVLNDFRNIGAHIPYDMGKMTGMVTTLLAATILHNKKLVENTSEGELLRIRNLRRRAPVCIIVTPTHELAIKIYDMLTKLAQWTTVTISLAIGGQKSRPRVTDIVVGCPGKLHHLAQDYFTGPAKFIAIDEPKNLMDKKWKDTIHNMCWKFRGADEHTRFLFLSGEPFDQSTYEGCMKLMGYLIPDDEHRNSHASEGTQSDDKTVPIIIKPIAVSERHEGALKQHFLCARTDEERQSRLVTLLQHALTNECRYAYQKMLVFTNHTKEVDQLVCDIGKKYGSLGQIVYGRHSKLKQVKREKVLDDFIKGHWKVLITTPSLADGSIIEGVDVIIHYRLPKDLYRTISSKTTSKGELKLEAYIKRNRCAGRVGNRGTSYALYDETDSDLFTPLAVYLERSGQVGDAVQTVKRFEDGDSFCQKLTPPASLAHYENQRNTTSHAKSQRVRNSLA
ncbi:DEAD/DEAH box helicase [Lasiodiplodia theobromae]|uniref:DEAD/DEAH box helicase n=1 Tax=Lasiodiplodia theobromae TaxID=45133 RepID=UPI0015C2DEA8|nr:DEAD/DEAH box helicase [Lasiodiplodia theobromae]KAF4534579.1 DEAD/DEAH box helicase [Lasiodiplodia theobromae]